MLFSGFYAIVAAIDGNFDRAGIAIFVAMVFDGLDGRIARWTNTQSEFGKEYDSLADMVAFGLAPAIVAYQWGVARIAEYGALWGRFGWLATFFYAACAAFRLARFNARSAGADKRYFEGLPSPSGAALLAGFVWMLNDLQREGLRALILAFAVALHRRRPDGQPLPLPERQGLQPQPPHPVRVPAAGAARLRHRRTRARRRCCSACSRCTPRRARTVWLWRRMQRLRRPPRRPAAARRVTGTLGVTDARRLAYLEALGVDVYVRRSLPPVVGGGRAACRSVRGGRGRASGAAARRPKSSLDWDALRATVAACTRCALSETRTQTVFGVGNPRARWMVIGEAPGAEEDQQGEPFVGRAGQLLTSMLRALGFGREDVFIANVLKCRPPGNRDPQPEEAAHCRGYLERQIELVAPALMIAVGRIAAQNLLATDTAARAAAGPGARARAARLAAGRRPTTRPTCCAAPVRSARPGRTCCSRGRYSSASSAASGCCLERRRRDRPAHAVRAWCGSAP